MRLDRLQRREFMALLGGAAAVWPLAARSQQLETVPRIGVLWHAGSVEEEGEYFIAFRQGFRDLGYVEGRNIRFDDRFPGEAPERFRRFAAELVALKVDVLVCVTRPATDAARAATTAIPIVFISIPDPVAGKLVTSLARPGANMTGLSNMAADLMAKRLQLLKEMVPGLSRAALLVNPLDTASARRSVDEVRTAAGVLNVTVQPYGVQAAEELEAAFSAIVRGGMQGVFVVNNPVIFNARKRIAELALAKRLPLLLQNRPGAEAGALMSFGTDSRVMFRRAAFYVDRIVKGANAGDLPVEQPTKFEFLINLKTARLLSIEVPPTLLARADELIE
jgi:putative ABC transport system substrate-binding protein